MNLSRLYCPFLSGTQQTGLCPLTWDRAKGDIAGKWFSQLTVLLPGSTAYISAAHFHCLSWRLTVQHMLTLPQTKGQLGTLARQMSSRWPFIWVFKWENQVVSKVSRKVKTVIEVRSCVWTTSNHKTALVSINSGHLANRRYPSVVNQKALVDAARHLHKQRQSAKEAMRARAIVTPDSALLFDSPAPSPLKDYFKHIGSQTSVTVLSARQALNSERGILETAVVLVHTRFSWIDASLNGAHLVSFLCLLPVHVNVSGLEEGILWQMLNWKSIRWANSR